MAALSILMLIKILRLLLIMSWTVHINTQLIHAFGIHSTYFTADFGGAAIAHINTYLPSPCLCYLANFVLFFSLELMKMYTILFKFCIDSPHSDGQSNEEFPTHKHRQNQWNNQKKVCKIRFKPHERRNNIGISDAEEYQPFYVVNWIKERQTYTHHNTHKSREQKDVYIL